MPEYIVAALSLAAFGLLIVGYVIGKAEGQSLAAQDDLHCSQDDLERRARRCQQ